MCNPQAPNTTHRQYTEDLIVKSFKVADIYEKTTHNDVFIERVDAFIRHNIDSYWPKPH